VSTQKLRAVFMDSLGIPADTDWETLSYRGIAQWDSVAHMQLVGEIEQRFDVMLETQDVLAMSSFAATKAILVRQGVSFD
jgi:acyl carrier protein